MKKNKIIYRIMNVIFIAVILLFSFSVVMLACSICEEENEFLYAKIVSLLLFFIFDFIFENKILEQYQVKGLRKRRWIRYLAMIIGYELSFGKFSGVGFTILFCGWFLVCMFEYFFDSLFSRRALIPHNIKCKTETFITHDNILQMKDGKVNFKIEDQDVCIIEKDEIEYITYKMQNPRRQRESDRIIYIAKDKKKHICDGYKYLGKDWIEFRKYNIRNIEIIILPSEQINCVRSCNKERCHSIIDGKES